MKKKILSISTLYNKGGAAYIAKTLHEGLQVMGYESIYIYGYGKRGFQIRYNNNNVVGMKYSNIFTPQLNFLVHSLIGKDLLDPNIKELEDKILWADVIICHTLHSYMLNFETFFSLLSKYSGHKKIIFVAHDSWHYTGRCAFRFDCEDWREGCLKCTNKNYYPSTLLSNSIDEFNKKVNLINRINNLIFVTPAEWIKKDLQSIYKNEVIVIRNGINTDFVIKRKEFERKTIREIQFCVSCVDLLQEGKVKLSLIKELLEKGYNVHLIGKNNPFSDYPNAIYHGYISDKTKYLEILVSMDCYLFTSSIDIYPTVLIEAICAGCFILYTDSKGSNEIMNNESNWLGKKISDVEGILEYLSSEAFFLTFFNFELRYQLVKEAITFFDKKRMITTYLNIINSNDF